MSFIESDYVRNIKKLKMITETISQFEFDRSASKGKFEIHETLLETYWQNCISASFDFGNDIPFDDSVFWLQSKGEQRYLAARERLIGLLICHKMYILTTSHKCTSLNQATYHIYNFNEATPVAVLETYAELLEQYWLKFLDSYSTILNGNMAPQSVTDVYLEKEAYYINAKLKLKSLLHHYSQIFIDPNDTKTHYNGKSNNSIFERTFSSWQKFRNLLVDYVNQNASRASETYQSFKKSKAHFMSMMWNYGTHYLRKQRLVLICHFLSGFVWHDVRKLSSTS